MASSLVSNNMRYGVWGGGGGGGVVKEGMVFVSINELFFSM